jgi:hypothetical protein
MAPIYYFREPIGMTMRDKKYYKVYRITILTYCRIVGHKICIINITVPFRELSTIYQGIDRCNQPTQLIDLSSPYKCYNFIGG